MRPSLRALGAAGLAVLVMQCTPPGTPSLELIARPRKIIDDGQTALLSVTATDGFGKVGAGVVTFTALHGTFGESRVTLDAYGTGKTTYACEFAVDPLCSGNIDVIASWNGVRAEVAMGVDERCPGGRLCGGACSSVTNDWFNCGACGVKCSGTEACTAGACRPCLNGDCDGDGWSVTDGDCCDQYDVCTKPAGANPGAIESLGNGLDDNCNGLLDDADTLDVGSCDTNLGPRATTAMDFARAMGLCRIAPETSPMATRAWGVVSAELMTADGNRGYSPNAASIRPVFGVVTPFEGARLAVFSTGPAADNNQTQPSLMDSTNVSSVNIRTCTADPGCIADWFLGGRPPLKLPGKLPGSPNCSGSDTNNDIANDSMMLRLRIRAPSNAGSFKVKTRFYSEEYPSFVCSSFNDQVVLLIDTPGATNLRNPSDKNLMTYTSAMGSAYPIGINLATGTPLFQSCTTQAAAPACWNTSVNASSCGLGPGDLAQTQFAAPDGGCVNGGATKWLVTSGNVKPGEIFELRAAVWNVSDHSLDSLFLMDDFRWSVDAGEPGTGEE